MNNNKDYAIRVYRHDAAATSTAKAKYAELLRTTTLPPGTRVEFANGLRTLMHDEGPKTDIAARFVFADQGIYGADDIRRIFLLLRRRDKRLYGIGPANGQATEEQIAALKFTPDELANPESMAAAFISSDTTLAKAIEGRRKALGRAKGAKPAAAKKTPVAAAHTATANGAKEASAPAKVAKKGSRAATPPARAQAPANAGRGKAVGPAAAASKRAAKGKDEATPFGLYGRLRALTVEGKAKAFDVLLDAFEKISDSADAMQKNAPLKAGSTSVSLAFSDNRDECEVKVENGVAMLSGYRIGLVAIKMKAGDEEQSINLGEVEEKVRASLAE